LLSLGSSWLGESPLKEMSPRFWRLLHLAVFAATGFTVLALTTV